MSHACPNRDLHISDNVVLLQFLRGDSRIKRGITVMKTRASAHDPQILRIRKTTGDGFVVGDHFDPDDVLRVSGGSVAAPTRGSS